MNHDICAQFKRSHKIRRRDRAVHKERQIIFVSKFGKRGNVGNVKFRVANRFDVKQFRLVRHKVGKIFDAVIRDVTNFNAEIFQFAQK